MVDPDLPTEKLVPEPVPEPVSEPAKPKSYGASLFGVEDEPVVAAAASIPAENEFENELSSSDVEEEPAKVEMPTMSTGEAIFADLVSVS